MVQRGGITTQIGGSGTPTVFWITDELSTSAVFYGEQPGMYTGAVIDPLYSKQHALVLTGLTAGVTYYCQIHSTDRSDNTDVSPERIPATRVLTYLPLLTRNRP